MKYHFDYVSEGLRALIEPATMVPHSFEDRLSFRVFKNAFIAPYHRWEHSIGCVIDESGKAVKDSECYEWKEGAGFFDLDKARTEHRKVVFLGFLPVVFGHSFTDNLRKLWFLGTDGYRSLAAEGYEPVYTTSFNQSLSEPSLEMVRLAGVDISGARHITELTRFDEVIVPDNCLRATDAGRIYCKEYLDLLDRIKDRIPCGGDTPPKVYFTRTKFTSVSWKEIGEKAIERVFRKLGYTIMAPEEYPVLEMLRIVRGCESFASTEGSSAHISLFARPGTAVTIINKASYLNFHQVMINELADLDVTYVEAHHSSRADVLYPWWGPFYLCINQYLERYVGHPLFHLPYWMRLSYWLYCRGLPVRIYRRIKKAVMAYISRQGEGKGK